MIPGRELTHSAFQVDALDGFRGLAVLIVFFSHASILGYGLVPGLDFAGTGKSGVYLFFVLSAFLLTYPFVARGRAAIDRRFLGNYLLRRFLRVYPLYLLFLLLAVVTTPLLADARGAPPLPLRLELSGFWQHLFLRAGDGVTWSIAAEFKYYFFLPALGLAYAMILRNHVPACAALTAALVLAAELVFPHAASLKNDVRLGPYLPIFFVGAFLAVCHHRLLRAGGPTRRWRTVLEALAMAALVLFLTTIPALYSALRGIPADRDHFHREFILFGLLWGLMLLATIHGRGYLRRVFEHPLLRYYGFVSFSVYLTHLTVLQWLGHWVGGRLPGPAVGWLALALATGLSHLTFAAVERPFSRLKLSAVRGGGLVSPVEPRRGTRS